MREMKKIAAVTGGNRGIGFEVCRQLARQGLEVILTARDAKAGAEAVTKLAKEDLKAVFVQLDVDSAASIGRFKQTVEKQWGRLDVLVNNAGILIDADESAMTAKLDGVRKTAETNVYGPLLLCQAFIPLMLKNGYGRVVNISSGMGQLTDMNGGYLAYRLSKASLNVLTRVFADEAGNGSGVLINSMAPGWVRTDMGGSSAPRTPEEGADTVVWLATLPESGPTGGFFEDREPIDW
jgi:NAD(P)-dependent dehydrogenase (short-subunit alcohol dehydrogenase family)